MENVLGIGSCGSLDMWDSASGSLRHTKSPSLSEGRSNWSSSLVKTFIANNVQPCVSFVPDGRRALVILELGSLKQLLHCSLPEIPTSLAFSIDGSFFAAGSYNGYVNLWALESGTMLASFRPHLKDIKSLAFSADGMSLITSSSDSMISVFDVGNIISFNNGICSPIVRSLGHNLPVTIIVAFPVSNRFLSGSLDRTIRMWTIGNSEPDFVFEYDCGITSIVIDPAESFFCAGTLKGKIFRTRLLHTAASLAESSQITAMMDLSASHSSSINSLALNYDCSQLASADEHGSVKVWDLISLQCIHTLRNVAHPKSQYCVVMFQADQDRFVDGRLLHGFCNSFEFQPLQKVVQNLESRSTSILLSGASPLYMRYVRPELKFQEDLIANEEQGYHAQLLAQEVTMRNLNEEKDRWARVASKLYDLCSNQILL